MYILRSINATNQFFHLFAEDIIIAHTFVFQETLEISEFFGSHLQIFADENRRKASVPPASTVAGDVIKPQARKPPQLQIVRYLRDGRRLDGPAVTTTTQCAPGRHVPALCHTGLHSNRSLQPRPAPVTGPVCCSPRTLQSRFKLEHFIISRART